MHISNPFLVAGISTVLALGVAPIAQSQTTITPTSPEPLDSERTQAGQLTTPADWLTSEADPVLLADTSLEDPSLTPLPALTGVPGDRPSAGEESVSQDRLAQTSEENLAPTLESTDEDPLGDAAPQDEYEDAVEALEQPPSDDAAGEEPGGAVEEPQTNPTDPDLAPELEDLLSPSPATEDSSPAPDYLNPDPNPLAFPTRPEEVNIVGTQPITLEQAIELARRNNRELQVAELEWERSRASLQEARAANLPTLDLGASLTVVENDVEVGNFFQPGVEDDVSVNATGVLEINYDLYTSGRRSASIRAAEANVRFNQLQVETLVEQLVLDVTNDYYDVQESVEQVRISEAALEQALVSLRDAEALERAGVGTRFDVLQAQVDVANARQELTQDISDQRIARRRLVQRLSLAEQVDVTAADPVELAAPWDLDLEDTIVLAYRNRSELEQQLLQRDIADEQRRVALGADGPQVSLFARYTVSDVVSRDLIGQVDQRDEYSFGAQLQWSLFDGGASRARANQEEANIAIAETQFADTLDRVRLQVEEAYLSLQASLENVQTARLALDQARESLRLARLRFQAGVGTQSDVLRSQTELTRAELNLLQAILGYNRSRISLQRSVSNFPGGDLSDQP